MNFKVVGEFSDVETIVTGTQIRELARLKKTYGTRSSRWRKKKGIVLIQLVGDIILRRAEVHWYECHGIGKKELKIKRILQKAPKEA